MRKSNKNRGDKVVNTLRAAVFGLAVGDAIGVPYEFLNRGEFVFQENRINGFWSDDTAMTLATCDSIRKNGKIDLFQIMKSFDNWLYNGAYTPSGKAYGVGNTTKKAIDLFHKGEKPEKCGQKRERDNGNGALMRILPLAFLDSSAEDVDKVSSLTHNHEISKEGCRLYIQIAKELLMGEDLGKSINKTKPTIYYKRIHELKDLPEEVIRSSGYVVDTLEAVLWCLIHTDNFRDCILKAIHLGGDTDTIAAIVGGLAGILYGMDGIPKKWMERLEGKEIIESCLW